LVPPRKSTPAAAPRGGATPTPHALRAKLSVAGDVVAGDVVVDAAGQADGNAADHAVGEVRDTRGAAARPPPALLSAPVAGAHPDLRGRILRVATLHFAERGYGATSIREVVEAVGCTKPALYYYFPSKEALFLEALADPLERYAQLLTTVAALDQPFRTKVRLLVEQLLHHVEAEPEPMRLALTAHLRPERGQPSFDVDAAREATSTAMLVLVRQGLAEGAVRPDIAPEHIARFLMGLLHETAMESLHHHQGGCRPPALAAAEPPGPAYQAEPVVVGLAPANPTARSLSFLLTDLFFHGVKP
jgi:TetR/AcrR family transcriptional regulator